MHLTETCEKQQPRLITQVETTLATLHHVKATAKIQDQLASKDQLTDIHVVDEGYMEIDLLVDSQQKGIDLVGPVPSSKSWQDREEGTFDQAQFQIDWERMIVTCPNGNTNVRWSERKTWR